MNPLEDIFHSVNAWHDEIILVWFFSFTVFGFKENLRMGYSQNHQYSLLQQKHKHSLLQNNYEQSY